MRIRIIAVALIVCTSFVSPAPAAADGLGLLPENAQGVLTIANLETLYSKLGIDALREERPDDVRLLSEELVETVGVDLLDPAAMKAEGFRVDRPFHIGVLDDPPAVVVLIPGEDRALDWVRARMELLGVRFAREEKVKGATVDVGESDEVACFEHKGYVCVVVTDKAQKGGSALATATAIVDGGRSVAALEPYRDTMGRLPGDADATIYMGPGFRSLMSSWNSSRQDLSEYGLTEDDMQSWERELGLAGLASAVSVRIAPDRFTVDGFSLLPGDSPAREWMVVDTDPVSFLKRTPSDPWLATISRVNAGAVWDALAPLIDRKGDEGETFREGLDKVKTETGLDLENDIIRQLDGNLGMLVSRVAFVGTDIVLLAQVRDPARFADTLDRVSALIEEDIEKKRRENPDAGGSQAQLREDVIGGIPVHCLAVNPSAEFCYGMIDDHLVVASMPSRIGEISAGGSSFVETIGNADVRDALLDPRAGAFYIDFRSLSRDAQAILPMLGPRGVAVSQLLAELAELTMTSRIDDDGIVQKTTLSSTRPGVWKYLFGLLMDEAIKAQAD